MSPHTSNAETLSPSLKESHDRLQETLAEHYPSLISDSPLEIAPPTKSYFAELYARMEAAGQKYYSSADLAPLHRTIGQASDTEPFTTTVDPQITLLESLLPNNAAATSAPAHVMNTNLSGPVTPFLGTSEDCLSELPDFDALFGELVVDSLSSDSLSCDFESQTVTSSELSSVISAPSNINSGHGPEVEEDSSGVSCHTSSGSDSRDACPNDSTTRDVRPGKDPIVTASKPAPSTTASGNIDTEYASQVKGDGFGEVCPASSRSNLGNNETRDELATYSPAAEALDGVSLVISLDTTDDERLVLPVKGQTRKHGKKKPNSSE